MSKRLRVLLVPDSIFWVTGTIARSIVRHNPSIEGTIISGSLLNRVLQLLPDLFSRFEVVHFTCSYASRDWLPRLQATHACVTTHHHVTDWELQKHNLNGDAIMTDSEEWVEDVVRRGVDRERVLSIPTGVDCDLFAPLAEEERARTRRRFGIARDTLAIGFFGKNSSNEMGRKGIDVMIAAAKLLRANGTRFSLVMTGPGWREVVNDLRRSGVDVIWRAFIRERSELAKLYGALDFYWVTSRIEGGPATLVEAMSSQVCCITTPVGIAREIVRHGENAALVPIGEAEAVAAATSSLAQAPERRARLGINARADVRARLDSSLTMQRAVDLYARALRVSSKRTGQPDGGERLVRGAEPREDGPDAPWPLETIPGALRGPLRRWEAIEWAEHLAQHQAQPWEALRLIAGELRREPLQGETWRAFLRNVLPQPIVRMVARGRQTIRARL